VGAATLLVWEFLLTLKYEHNLIWKYPMNYIKWTYLFLRYFALTVQFVNIHIVLNLLTELPFHQEACRLWLLYLIIASSLLLLVVQIILALQVYALYSKDSRISAVFITLFMTEVSLATACAYPTYTTIPFDATCNAAGAPSSAVYYLATVIILLTVIWVTTLAKSHRLQHVPVFQAVLRNGGLIYLVVC
ncbi:hypothetical protein BDQ17DRAFT_1199498, partial [Cyathus striatus]